MQAEHGDNDDIKQVLNVSGPNLLLPAPLLAARRESNAYWEGRLGSLQQAQRGLSQRDADLAYLDGLFARLCFF